MKRQADGPLGIAFVFLCLLLAPLSLKISGGVVNLDQRLRAVADAWSQIASVFSADYPGGTPGQGSAAVASISDQDQQPDTPQLQYSRTEASAVAVNEPEQPASPRIPSTARCPKHASRKVNVAFQTEATARPYRIAPPAMSASLIKAEFAVEVAKATQLDRATRERRASRVRDEMTKYCVELSSAAGVGREVVLPNVMVALKQLPFRLSDALKRCTSTSTQRSLTQRWRAKTDGATEHRPRRVILAAPLAIEFDAVDTALEGETSGFQPWPIP